jgi:ketosteroid isomerase-like protein
MNIRAKLVEICDAFNAHDRNRIMSFFADDCVLETPEGCEPYGPRFEGKHNVAGSWLHVLRDYPTSTTRVQPQALRYVFRG